VALELEPETERVTDVGPPDPTIVSTTVVR
jgi:hypothetical protein